jgi:hypothetical protein
MKEEKLRRKIKREEYMRKQEHEGKCGIRRGIRHMRRRREKAIIPEDNETTKLRTVQTHWYFGA